MKITSSRINTLLTIGENLNIEFKRAGDEPKADTFESVCAFRYGRITPKNLEPEPKNPIIANFFHQIRLADELGSGVRNLYHYVKIYSNAEPVFDEDDVFRLTVPLDDAYSADRAFEGELSQTGTAQTMTQKSNEELDPNRQAVGLAVGLGVGLGSLVLNEVTANPQIKMSEIALKYHVSKRTVERIFGKLSQDGQTS